MGSLLGVRREYPLLPLVGVGAVIRRGDEVLLVKRASPPKIGYYSIPGGLVEVGEEIREAVKREIKEETGLVVELENLIGVIDNIVRDSKGRVQYHYILIDFLARVKGGELQSASDTKDVRWVHFKDLEKYKLTETAKYLFKKLGFI